MNVTAEKSNTGAIVLSPVISSLQLRVCRLEFLPKRVLCDTHTCIYAGAPAAITHCNTQEARGANQPGVDENLPEGLIS